MIASMQRRLSSETPSIPDESAVENCASVGGFATADESSTFRSTCFTPSAAYSAVRSDLRAVM